MRVVTLHEAKTQLSRLIARAAKGEAFVIAKAGRPLAKVVPFDVNETAGSQRLGFLAGAITVPDDFDRLGQAEIEGQFGAHD